jgi:competence protein ComEC
MRTLTISGGAISVLDGLPVGWLLSSLPSASSIVAHAPRSIVCYAGQRWQWDGVQFEVLHPALDSYAETERKTNDRSCVLKVTSSDGALLLTGHIEARSENELLARASAKLKADVLVVPHHGSRTSSTDAFIAAVKPAWVVYTVGYRNRFGRPRPDIIARYEAVTAGASRSDRDGALLLRVWGPQTTPAAWRQVARRYWQD